MNQRSIFTLLLMAAFIGYLWFENHSSRNFSWERGLSINKNQPYDLSVFFQTIEEEYKDNFSEIGENESLKGNISLLETHKPSVWMYTGRVCYLSKAEAGILANHLKKGGTVFISAERMPQSLFSEIPALRNCLTDFYEYDAFRVEFSHPEIKPKHHRFLHYEMAEPAMAYWNSFFMDTSSLVQPEQKENSIDSGAISVLSSTPQSQPDFLRVRFGSGSLYLHANPVMFSNVYQTLPSGRDYFAAVLRHIPGKSIVFDHSAGIPKQEDEFMSHGNFLDFIRKEPPLWNAGQLLLISCLLFLAFAGRRKQRSIPVIEPPANHTMAFIDAIGRFYKNEQQNALVFRRERAQFFSFVQHQFRIRLSALEEEDIVKLSLKSGVGIETIRKIADMHSRYHQKNALSDTELIEINKATSRFYNEYRNNYGKSGNSKRSAKSA